MRRIRTSAEMKVLSFAAVGFHGREWWRRRPSRAHGLVMVAACAAISIGAPLSSQDLAPNVGLHTRLLLAQRAPMLDVVAFGDRLLVLEPGRVILRPRADGAGDAPPPIASAAITTTRIWPRDLRGRLKMTAASYEALLPGVTCRGSLAPLSIACADEGESWPLGIANDGVVPGRNHFTTPEGLAFFGAAPLGTSGTTGGARWLVAEQRGVLAFLDASRAVVSRAGPADDVVRIEEPCAAGTHVVAVVRTTDPDADALLLSRVSGETLTPLARLGMPGTVIALWIGSGERLATAVVRAPGASRYEAFHVGVSCAR